MSATRDGYTELTDTCPKKTASNPPAQPQKMTDQKQPATETKSTPARSTASSWDCWCCYTAPAPRTDSVNNGNTTYCCCCLENCSTIPANNHASHFNHPSNIVIPSAHASSASCDNICFCLDSNGCDGCNDCNCDCNCNLGGC
jgi:hypothetical protein